MYVSYRSEDNKIVGPNFNVFNLFFSMVHGPPYLSVQSKSALTDRNMHAKNNLKVVLKS